MDRVMIAIAMLSVPLTASATDAAQTIDFNQDIRPVLSENCFRCHGPDGDQREADLRLDTPQRAFRDLGGHFALVPHKPDESELYLRIIDPDNDIRMPPPDSGKRLTDHQIHLIRQWIEQGARWQKHWAYIEPQKPDVPDVEHAGFVRNAIDRFVLGGLRKAGLQPSPSADRVTLIRRLSFDLIGLPPSPQDVDEFVTDPDGDAFEKLSRRLLQNPHYAERMAMYWLDLVRYADTNGFHFDQHRDIFPYRDYVIRAFHENKPFDQFTIEQIAGDLLPDATLEQKVASGYNRLNMVATEGGVQPKEYLAKYATDRVSTTATVWLGSTMGCSECHDHKYDPFTMRDFYSFAAFFADLQEVGRYTIGINELPPQIAVPIPEQAARLEQLDRKIARLTRDLETAIPESDLGRMEWEQQVRSNLKAICAQWMCLRPESSLSSGDATLTLQDDLSVQASGTNPDTDTYTVIVHTDQTNITGIRLEVLTHPDLSLMSLSRGSGNFVLSEFTVDDVSSGTDNPHAISISDTEADFFQQGFPVRNAVDGNLKTGWSVAGFLKRQDCSAAFRFAEPIAGGPGTTLRIRMLHESDTPRNNIGRFRLALSVAVSPELSDGDGLPAGVIDVVAVEPSNRSWKQQAAVQNYYHTIAPELVPIREQITQARQDRLTIQKSIPQTLVSKAVVPRVMRVLERGNWMDESGEIVSPAVPQFLALEVVSRTPQAPENTEGSRLPVRSGHPFQQPAVRLSRLDLADWLVSRDNPLTARVFVNRLWKQFFGSGLVTTLDDFGSQGNRPSHPELLDYLAVEFIDSGWDVKHMVNLIVTSGTYRQSSQIDRQLRQRDPGNRWLARQSSFRLDAELVRDNALSISGLLDATVGGRSVRPYQPDGYWDHANMSVGDAGRPRYIQDHDGNLYRRGLYTYWKRTFLHPAMLVFDAPTRESCCVDRPRSNTPLQALVLLNDVQFVEAARVFAQRIIRSGGPSFESRLNYAYRQALTREPESIDRQALKPLYRRHLGEYTHKRGAAEQLIAVGESSPPDDIDVAELAAWTSLARVILNLHETITRN